MFPLKIFEPHAHMTSRTTADYELMAGHNYKVVVEPAFWLGEERKRTGTFLDYFDLITNYETSRAALYNIDHYCCISVNPKESNNEDLANSVLDELPKYLDNKRVLAVGEIGYDRISAAEEKYLKIQLDMSLQFKLPALIHSPHLNKYDGIRRIIQLLKRMNYPMDRVLIDHNTEETAKMVLDSGAYAGFTIYPITKMTPERFYTVLKDHMNETDKILINSSVDWGPSDPLMVYHTVNYLKFQNVNDDIISRIVWDNPVGFYSKSRRLRI